MTADQPVPLILDFDGSVLPFCSDDVRVPLQGWQERIRFGCTKKDFARLEAALADVMPGRHGCVFTGSGDYHHVSALLVSRLAQRVRGPISLVVLDNHPDNMRYPFGIHCGSWVYHVSAMTAIRDIHVVGITSRDISWRRAWENYLSPLLRGKLVYWSVNVGASWLGALGVGFAHRNFSSADALVEAFEQELAQCRNIYCSLDKDVFSPEVARSTWDQGRFAEGHVERLLRACAGKLVGADVCGEVSEYRYASRFKRLLTRLDGLVPLAPGCLEAWQAEHREVNRRLFALISAAMAADQPVACKASATA